jgi:hypothetical protein
VKKKQQQQQQQQQTNERAKPIPFEECIVSSPSFGMQAVCEAASVGRRSGQAPMTCESVNRKDHENGLEHQSRFIQCDE